MKRTERENAQDGAILVVVMVTLLFTAAALLAFIEKASTDLLVEARVGQADRLRIEAYSALEVTLAVLEDFREADNGLHSTAEGWGDPLGWAGWTPSAGRTVEIAFQDESGKIPLNHVDSATLVNEFEVWGIDESDAEHLADEILSWMQQNYVPATAVESNYEEGDIPYDPPLRAMRTYSELAAIDFVRDTFYDQNGRPNEYWWRFTNDFSLFNFRQPDVNGTNTDVLAGLGQFDDKQAQAISDFQAGAGQYKDLGKNWLTSSTDLRNVVGSISGNMQTFGYTIAALRILVTVHEGQNVFRLSAVVAPQGGASTVQTTATDIKKASSNSSTGETAAGSASLTTAQPTTAPTTAQTSTAATSNIQYPFTILEILENDEIPTPPPPPPPPAS